MKTLAGVPLIGGKEPRILPTKTRIGICTPTLKWESTSGIADFMLNLGYLTGNPLSPWAFDSYQSVGSSTFSFPGDLQRNILVKKFLEGKCEWLWFIDSDILPPDNSLELLKLLPKADVVSGIYPLMNDPNKPNEPPVAWTVYDIYPEGFKLKDISREGEITEAAGVGTGFMLIHRRVLEDERMYHDSLAPCDPRALFRIDREANGRPKNTEDLAFCRKLAENDYKLIVHTGVRCGHVKTENVANVQRAMDVAFQVGFKCGLARDTDFCRSERSDKPTRSSDDDGRVLAETPVN